MNDRVHPIFKAALSSMKDLPSQPPHHQDVPQDVFDEWNNELFHDLCGKRQGPVVQDLLILLSQVDTTEASFGVNADRFMRMAVPMMQKLREACKDDFKDL